MKTVSIRRALTKAGVEIHIRDDNGMFWVESNDHILSWFDNSGVASCVHVQRSTDQADPQSDWFPGHFPRTLASALGDVGILSCGHVTHEDGGPSDYPDACRGGNP